MINARWNGPDASMFGDLQNIIWKCIRCEVEVADRFAQQLVSNAAPDEEELIPLKRIEDLLGGVRAHPICVDDRHAAIRSASPRKMRAVAPQM